jgi:hypothetical protein
LVTYTTSGPAAVVVVEWYTKKAPRRASPIRTRVWVPIQHRPRERGVWLAKIRGFLKKKKDEEEGKKRSGEPQGKRAWLVNGHSMP